MRVRKSWKYGATSDIPFALRDVPENTGTAIAARTAITATTIMISTRVKPRWRSRDIMPKSSKIRGAPTEN